MVYLLTVCGDSSQWQWENSLEKWFVSVEEDGMGESCPQEREGATQLHRGWGAALPQIQEQNRRGALGLAL